VLFSDYIKREFFKRKNSIKDINLSGVSYEGNGIVHINGCVTQKYITKATKDIVLSLVHPSEIDPSISEMIDYYVIKNNKKTLSQAYINSLDKYVTMDTSVITSLKDNQYVLYNNISGEYETQIISKNYDHYIRTVLELDDVHPIDQYRFKNIKIGSNAKFAHLDEYLNLETLSMMNNTNIITFGILSMNNLTSLNIVNCKLLRRLPDLPNCKMLIAKNCCITDVPNLPKYMDTLDLSCNRIENVSKLPICTTLNISYNGIRFLPKLKSLDINCAYNNITSLNIGYKVRYLTCNNNRLTSINTNNIAILICNNNNIKSVTGMGKLSTLICNNNRISNISKTKYLQYINCSYNNGIQLELQSSCTRLEILYCNTVIFGSKLPQLKYISVDESTTINGGIDAQHYLSETNPIP